LVDQYYFLRVYVILFICMFIFWVNKTLYNLTLNKTKKKDFVPKMKYSKQFVEFFKILDDSSFEFISINYWHFFLRKLIYFFFFFSLIRLTQFGRKVETFSTFAPGSNFGNSVSDSGDIRGTFILFRTSNLTGERFLQPNVDYV
jgi:hypothetical protein